MVIFVKTNPCMVYHSDSQPNCINDLLETLINIFSLPLPLFVLVHYLNFGKLWFTSSVLAQSVERVTAKREVAGSIPGAGAILRALK